MSAESRDVRADRIRGAILGAAYGDALGSAFEFLPSETIERIVDGPVVRDFRPAARGSLMYPRAAGIPTDDTAMALSVAHAVASGEPLDAALFARRFLADLEDGRGRFAAMFWDGGPGGATTRALRRLQAGRPAAGNGHPDDGGNGAAMRAHPVGALAERDLVLRAAALQAEVTHGHPAAVAAAQAVAALVHDAIAGVPPASDPPAGIDDPQFVAAWRAAHRDLAPGERLPPRLRDVAMSGWETVAAAHAISLVYAGDPERAIGAAVASGGDTDTVANVVGALVGARYGARSLPERWRTTMPAPARRLCEDAAEALVAALA